MTGFLSDIKNNFLATGVGSLPFKDPRSALNFVFDNFSYHVPFWPQLPQSSFYENMYVQFSEQVPGIHIDEQQRSIWVDTTSPGYMGELEECFNKCQAFDVDHFAISRRAAESLYLFSQRLMALSWQGWVKAQIIGPFSLGLSLLDENKNPIIYNAELSELLPLILSLKASWLIKQIKAHAKTKMIIVIDEPYLVAVGTSQCSLPKEAIIDKINQLVSVIHDNGAYAGLHCCGNTDWEMVMSMDIDILNFDAYGFLDKLLLYEKALIAFLKKGRIPAIGIVPNNEDLLQEGIQERLFDVLKKHTALLKNGALITTSCGCSALSEELTQKAYGMCMSIAERLRGEL